MKRQKTLDTFVFSAKRNRNEASSFDSSQVISQETVPSQPLHQSSSVLPELTSEYTAIIFSVVEFEENYGGGVSIVCSKWFTPRKTEVFWPPIKDPQKFERVLKRAEDADCESWELYSVKTSYYETDDYGLAFKKLKKAEFTSDIQSDLETSNSTKRKRFPAKRLCSTPVSSDEDTGPVNNLLRPPKIQFRNELKNTNESDCATNTIPITSHHTSNELGLPCNNTPLSARTEEIDASNSLVFQKKLFCALATIQEQNKKIINILERTIEVQEKSNFLSSIPNNLPVKFPLENFEDVELLEQHLSDKNNLSSMIIDVMRNEISQTLNTVQNLENSSLVVAADGDLHSYLETNGSVNNLNFDDECSTLENQNLPDIKCQLKLWATRFQITHSALNELLRILSSLHLKLPLDSRTLLEQNERHSEETSQLNPNATEATEIRPPKRKKSQVPEEKMAVLIEKSIESRKNFQNELQENSITKQDDDKLFCLSLYKELKKVPENRRLATKIELLQVIQKGQSLPPPVRYNTQQITPTYWQGQQYTSPQGYFTTSGSFPPVFPSPSPSQFSFGSQSSTVIENINADF
ncbi:hypothetical protein FQR65_LT15315 [Abscondita terminalis]|nr:hypothetical protein FQR65_LT15315 [Abscondita terminalis]